MWLSLGELYSQTAYAFAGCLLLAVSPWATIAIPIFPWDCSTSAMPLALPPDGGLRLIWDTTFVPVVEVVGVVVCPDVLAAAVLACFLLPPPLRTRTSTTAITIAAAPPSRIAPPVRELRGA